MKYIMKSPFRNIRYEKLLEWQNTLNKWEWPTDFIFPKPNGFDEMNDVDKYDFPPFGFVFEALKGFICEYDRMKYHQCVAGYNYYDIDTNTVIHNKKTEEEFESWYSEHFSENDGDRGKRI